MQSVSVLMPCYNYAQYLPLAIESVLSQSHRSLELVIVDDCSTDDSLSIAEQWRRLDSRVMIVTHTKNRGLAAARNSALAVSTGDFVALCDADDIWLPQKLDRQLAIFQMDANVGVVHSNGFIMDAFGNCAGALFSQRFHHRDQRCQGMLFHDLCLGNFICNSTVVFRRECIELSGAFDERLRSLEDWLCWARMARRYQFGYVEAALVKYRVHAGNLSSNAANMARNRVTAISALLSECSDLPTRVRARLLYSKGISHMCLQEWPAARSEFLNSVELDSLSLRSWVRYGQMVWKCLF